MQERVKGEVMVYVQKSFEVFVSEEQFADQRAVFVLDIFHLEVPGISVLSQLEVVLVEEIFPFLSQRA